MTSLRGLFKPESDTTPRLDKLSPAAAMPGCDLLIEGSGLGPYPNPDPKSDPKPDETHHTSQVPTVTLGDAPAMVMLSRPDRVAIRVPAGAIPGDLVLHRYGSSSNPLHARIAVPMAENLHPVANPAVDADGRIVTTLSGARGQRVPVSIFSIAPDFQMHPLVRGLLNPTGLAFGPDGLLYVSSRAEGTVYRVAGDGSYSTYAEGLGIATGIAFDPDGNLYVGDRSGTIFKIAAQALRTGAAADPSDIFVFATLEPSMAAYHLAFNASGTLLVTAPTTSSNQAIHAIAPDGSTSVFYRGLGRAQGMAFDVDDNLYVAASLRGQTGIVRITPQGTASLAVAGANLVGLAFLDDGCAALATRDALYHIALDIEGSKLI